MLSGSNNILDQLLGGFETNPFAAAGKPAQGTAGESTGIMFGELLAGLIEDGQLMTDPDGLNSGACLFPTSDQPAAQDGAPAGQSWGKQSLIDVTGQAAAGQPFVLLGPVTFALPNGATIEPLTQNETALSAESGIPGAPVAGSNDPVYNIIDYRIEDGRIELTAVTGDQSKEAVRITIPVNVFEQALGEKLSALASRPAGDDTSVVASTPTPGAAPRLDSLLRASHVKDLTISPDIRSEAAPSTVTESPAPMATALVADNGGARFMITSKMTRGDLQTFSRLDRDGRPDVGLAQESPDAEFGLDPAAKNADADREVFEVLPLRRSLAALRFAPNEKISADAKLMGSEAGMNPAGMTSDKVFGDENLSTRTNIAPAVKFSLPETLPKSFASSGQTLMLKIEPEHLGPARLNLSVRDHVLSARVTVDTPIAKATVERSLEQLTETLSRAGIDVDRIEVMLGDNGAHEQFFDRRPLWSRSHSSSRSIEGDTPAAESVNSITPAVWSRQYVDRAGVNVLA